MTGALDVRLPGTVQDDDVFDMSTSDGRNKAYRAREMTRAIKERMSPAGALGLPELLDQRRLEYGIMDSAFTAAAAYDRIMVAQFSQMESETFGKDSKIVMPDTVREKELQSAPRGVIISAGLRALDDIRSNGMDLGHIIYFVRFSPWRIRFDIVEGEQFFLLVLRSGDIISSEDTARNLRSGKLRCMADRVENRLEHVYHGGEFGGTRPNMSDSSDEGY